MGARAKNEGQGVEWLSGGRLSYDYAVKQLRGRIWTRIQGWLST